MPSIVTICELTELIKEIDRVCRDGMLKKRLNNLKTKTGKPKTAY